MVDNYLTELFQKYAITEKHPTIQLEACDHTPIGALYLNGQSSENIVVCLCEHAREKYYLYIPSDIGNVAVFFTYFRKL